MGAVPTIRASEALNLTTVTFTGLLDHANDSFTDNAFWTHNGITYQDVLQFYDPIAGGQFEAAIFGGAGVTLDALGNITGGTARGFYSAITNGSAIVAERWALENFSYGALAIAQAAATANTGDDYQILASILSGADTFNLSSFADQVRGHAGNDRIFGMGGNDTLSGDVGADRIDGGEGDDRINGGADADVMLGGAGNDTYTVDNTDDRVFEATTTASAIDAGGFDSVLSSVTFSLNASAGARFVERLTLTGTEPVNGTGNALANSIVGNAADNILVGLDGRDSLRGGLGADRFVGGNGVDQMYAGVDTSVDTFVFNAIAEMRSTAMGDNIFEFDSGEDKLNFRAIDANTALEGDQNFAFSGTVRQANSLWFEISGSTVVLYGEVTGNLQADFAIQLHGIDSLIAADFVL